MRYICVTGATTGIGAALISMIPQAGDVVFMHYHTNRDACHALAAELKARDVRAEVLQADFASEPEVGARRLSEAIRVETNHLDVLVNNAGGVLDRGLIGDVDHHMITKTLNLNLNAPIFLTSFLMPLLRAAGTQGRADIINITSIAARSGAPTATAYGAAKAGLENFTRGIAKEAGPSVRANSVSPGVIDTPFHQGKTPKERMDQWLAATPVGHHGEPKDIARAVQFVLENEFLTGAVIPVNGGIQMI